MKTIYITAILLLGVPTISRSEDLTAQELSKHFGISSWQTHIDLPPGTFTVSLSEVVEGKITGMVLEGIRGPSDDTHGQRLAIMASPTPQGTQLSVVMGGVSINNIHLKKKPQIPINGSCALPNKIGFGTYVLGGQFILHDGVAIFSNEASDLKLGLILNIAK